MRFKSSGRLKCKACGAQHHDTRDMYGTFLCQRCGGELEDACSHELGVYDGKRWACRRCGAKEITEEDILLRVLTYSNGMCDAPCCEDPDCEDCRGANTGEYGVVVDE